MPSRQPFTDSARPVERRRPRRAPDWGGDAVFATPPRPRADERAGAQGELAAPLAGADARDQVDRELAALAAGIPAGTNARTPSAAPPAAGRSRPTVRVTGRPGAAGPHAGRARRRPPRRPHERLGARPDRVAAWAVVLGLLLVLIAVLSSL